uniref:Ribosomal protein S4 n=1 Tax=Gefionella okellyi TaxID=2853422 RepID=A0A0B5GWE3_9EUKA|nr:ribosomal protein S4 [Gefionella okellyi]
MKKIQIIHLLRQTRKDLWGFFKNRRIRIWRKPGQHFYKYKRIKRRILFINKKYNKKYNKYRIKKYKVFNILKKDILYLFKKYYINVSYKQFKHINLLTNYIQRIKSSSKYIKKEPYLLLERRLDTIIYRLNISNSLIEAKKLISYGNILINNKIIKNTSYILRSGDTIGLINKIQLLTINNLINKLKTNKIKINIPIYLEINFLIKKAIYLYNPIYNIIPYPIKLKHKLK